MKFIILAVTLLIFIGCSESKKIQKEETLEEQGYKVGKDFANTAPTEKYKINIKKDLEILKHGNLDEVSKAKGSLQAMYEIYCNGSMIFKYDERSINVEFRNGYFKGCKDELFRK